MMHMAVITQNKTSGMYNAKWFSEHSSHGLEASGRDMFEALENLIKELEKHDKHLEFLAAIDEEIDP